MHHPRLKSGSADCAANLFGRALHEFSECLKGRSPAQRLARSVVHQIGDRVECLPAMNRQIGVLVQELTQQSVGVFAAAALPRAVGITEVHAHVCGAGESRMPNHFVPRSHVSVCRIGAANPCSLAVEAASAVSAVASGIHASSTRRVLRSNGTPTAERLLPPRSRSPSQ